MRVDYDEGIDDEVEDLEPFLDLRQLPRVGECPGMSPEDL